MVDVYKSDTSTNIIPEQILELPVPDRDFQNLAFIAPGVQRERGAYRFIGDSALIGSSGNASETAIIVDGVDFTDQALGLSRARFSQDAIGEFPGACIRLADDYKNPHNEVALKIWIQVAAGCRDCLVLSVEELFVSEHLHNGLLHL